MDLAEDERSLTGYGKKECLQRVEEKGESSSRLLNTAAGDENIYVVAFFAHSKLLRQLLLRVRDVEDVLRQ